MRTESLEAPTFLVKWTPTFGQSCHLLTETIAITITDFVTFSADEMPDVVNKFKLRAEAGRVYSDGLELVFAELPKFDKGERELATVLDRWFYFLKTAGDLTAIPRALQVEPAIVHAYEIANKCGLTPEELDSQERREIFIQDQRGAIALAEQRGATGRATGAVAHRGRFSRYRRGRRTDC